MNTAAIFDTICDTSDAKETAAFAVKHRFKMQVHPVTALVWCFENLGKGEYKLDINRRVLYCTNDTQAVQFKLALECS